MVALLIAVAPARADQAPASNPHVVAEPAGLYKGVPHGYTPTTLQGATVLATDALAKLIEDARPAMTIMTFTRRAATLGLLVLAAVASVAPARAGDNAPRPFTQAAFDAARAAGKPVLVDTYATWCDICARQMPIIDKLLGEPKYKDLVTLRVNFDTQKDVMRALDARLQSTLIAFRGDKEVARSVGETQPEWIDDLMSKAMAKAAGS